jgi:hypothetical protein
MHVQLNIELITKTIQLFCQKEIKEKDARKICESLAEDDDVEKHHFCGATCVKSKRTCMKEVDDHGMHCHVHDPDRKCKGTTIKGVNCRSVAKIGEDYCNRHHDQGGRSGKGRKRVIVEQDESASEDEPVLNKKSPRKASKKETKKSKSTHTSEYVVDSEEESLSDEESAPPKKNKKRPSKKKYAKKTKQVVTSEDEQQEISEEKSGDEPSSDEDTPDEDEFAIYESKQDKELPAMMFELAAKIGVVRHEMKNYSYLEWKKGKRYAKLADFREKLIQKYSKCKNRHLKKYGVEEPVEQAFKHLKLNRGKWTNKKILGEIGCYELDPEEGTADEEESASEEESMSEDEKPVKEPAKKNRKAKHEQSPPTRWTAVKNRQVDILKSNPKADSSECESSSEEEKMGEDIWMRMDPANLTSLESVIGRICFNWQIHPYNSKLEYSTGYTINGKYIVKMVDTNAYVDLCTLDHLQGNGGENIPITAQDQIILHKLKLHPLSPSEQKKLQGSVNKDDKEDGDNPVEVTVDKSKVKWKKFDKDLEYSKYLLVSGKHILKKRKQDDVVGLVTDEHINSEDVVFDRMTLKEKEKIFGMGFVLDSEYMREEFESDVESNASDGKQEGSSEEDDSLPESIPMEKKAIPNTRQAHHGQTGDEIERMLDQMNNAHPNKVESSDESSAEEEKGECSTQVTSGSGWSKKVANGMKGPVVQGTLGSGWFKKIADGIKRPVVQKVGQKTITSGDVDDAKAMVIRNTSGGKKFKKAIAKRDTDEDMQQLDIRDTAKDAISRTSKDVDPASIYCTEEDQNFLQKMCEIHGEIEALREEIREEYLYDDDPNRKILEDHKMLLWEEYKEYEKVHKVRYGTRHPPDDIVFSYDDIASNNRTAIAEQVLQSQKAIAGGHKAIKKSKGKQKQIRHVTCETDDESNTKSHRQKQRQIAM